MIIIIIIVIQGQLLIRDSDDNLRVTTNDPPLVGKIFILQLVWNFEITMSFAPLRTNSIIAEIWLDIVQKLQRAQNLQCAYIA